MGGASLRRLLVVTVGLLIALTSVGLAVEWPGAVPDRYHARLGPAPHLVNATVVGVTGCAGRGCEHVTVRLEDGQSVPLADVSYGAGIRLQPDDRIVVARDSDGGGPPHYSFADYQRSRPLLLLAALFAVVVVAVARWRGLAAFAGLAITWLILARFVLPGLLEGKSPVLLAIIGSAAVVLVVLYLAHGISIRTTTALIGTFASLGLTAVLASAFTTLTHISGASSDEASYLQTVAGNIDLRGVVLAGVVIGSLGVLNDVTVTQASAVWEIAAASPAGSIRGLYTAGMRVGRDHIASTVYTLVLAYAGATLPLLLLFTVADQSAGRVLTGDAVGEEILRTLVGAVGLVAAVPVTTVLAAALARHSARDQDVDARDLHSGDAEDAALTASHPSS
jgi:uncharacterized membrane protein